MRGIRFFVVNHSSDNVDLMNGLKEYDFDDGRIRFLLSGFDNSLMPAPHIASLLNDEEYVSFFTKEGLHYFEDEINDLIDFWKNELSRNVQMFRTDIDESKIVYQDKFQFLIHKNCI